jgi:PncC family amidohydrolase
MSAGNDQSLGPLAERLQGLCLGRGLTVATAESCTGGMIADVLTSIPGASRYVLGGVVAYADQAKVALLGVPEAMIEAHGAVSAQVARAMATAARDRFSSTLAVAVTGVAGPGGGSDAKPVGLTYLALADPERVEVRRLVWSGDRATNRLESTAAAIEWLIERAGG